MNIVSVGLDLSYTRTGFSVVKRCLESAESVIDEIEVDRFKTTSEHSFIHRTILIKQWIDQKLQEVLMKHKFIDIIVIEGPGIDGQMSAMMSGLDVTIMSFIYEKYCSQEMIVIPPRSLKKYAGVKGDSKTMVVNRFKEMYPGFRGVCHDEADATFLALLGADCRSFIGFREFKKGAEFAEHILYNLELNKKGQKKGLLHRPGEFFFPKRDFALSETLDVS